MTGGKGKGGKEWVGEGREEGKVGGREGKEGRKGRVEGG